MRGDNKTFLHKLQVFICALYLLLDSFGVVFFSSGVVFFPSGLQRYEAPLLGTALKVEEHMPISLEKKM